MKRALCTVERCQTVFAATLSWLLVSIQAEDWPQWGGNDLGRNMSSPAKGLPDAFYPGEMKPGTEAFDLTTAKNIKWIAKLGSATFESPTVAGGKVFIGTNNEFPRDPKHPGDRSILLCLDEQTGQFLWQLVIPKLAAGKVNDWEGLGLLSSPAIEGDRVYLDRLFRVSVLSRRIEWKNPLATRSKVACVGFDSDSRRQSFHRRRKWRLPGIRCGQAREAAQRSESGRGNLHYTDHR